MTFIDWVVFILFIGSLVFGIDKHLWVKEIEKDLKLLLGDFEVSRDAASSKTCACCRQTVIAQVKSLIRNHFVL